MIKTPWQKGDNMKEKRTEFENKINSLKDILVNEIDKSDRIFIFPHKNMDFDALASAVTLYTICKLNGKNVYIVTDDKESKMKSSFKKLYNELKSKCTFVTTNEFDMLRSKDELILLTDTNSSYLIPVTNIESLKNVIIIDHHNIDSNTIKTDKKFIDTKMSSASEILFYLMKSLDIYIDTYLAQLLLAGIYLDTKGLYYIPTHFTLESVTKILEYGANLKEVQDLFVVSDFEDDRIQERIINSIIDNTSFISESNYTLAISSNYEESENVYSEYHLVEAADRLLKYKLDVAFVIGHIDKEILGKGHRDLVCIKARSKSNNIDVSKIMNILGGGGRINSASAIIETNNIEGIKELITMTMTPGITREDIVEKLHIIKYGNKPKIYMLGSKDNSCNY